jgi:hypothetical protein
METGANISQVLLSASSFLNSKKNVRNEGKAAGGKKRRARSIAAKRNIVCKLALTKFFDLSNIRFVSRGSGEMFGASQCFRIKYFQFDGPTALAALRPLLRNLSIQIQNFSRVPAEVCACARGNSASFRGVSMNMGRMRKSKAI